MSTETKTKKQDKSIDETITCSIDVALAGNPNTGKSTLFNALTGLKQKVGNWPGVTVERKRGRRICESLGMQLNIVDLPGTYSLSAYSLDEEIARNYIIESSPDVVVQIVDASNLERNLYLTTMLMELGAKIVIALNMMDVTEKKKISIDVKKLSKELNIPIVPMIATSKTGIKELETAIATTYEEEKKYEPFTYTNKIESKIDEVEKQLDKVENLPSFINRRWLTIQIVQKDSEIPVFLEKYSVEKSIINELLGLGDEAYEMEIIEHKYDFISKTVEKVVKKQEKEDLSRSDLIDKVVTHKWLGIPVFLMVMWGVFQFVFAVSVPFMELIDMLFGWLAGVITLNIRPEWLGSLLGDGIVGGVGAVVIFVPPIFTMFFMLSILEDSGYLSRAAYVMDKFMTKIGLHGKSFVPMLMGFGCNVPAIMATRTLKNKSDRFVTILTLPFMSCGARIPVYILFAGLFFGASAGTVIFALYVGGMAVGILTAFLLRKFIFKGETDALIMELPPYHTPKLGIATREMWDKGKMYLKKAGTIILVGVVAVWFLAAMPFRGVEYGGPNTWLAAIGKFFEPLFRPLGFDWRLVVGLIVGFVAKELVVGALGAIIGTGEDEAGLRSAIQTDGGFYPLNALSLMVFTLLYVPCAATIGVIKKETGSWKWTIFSVIYTTGIAWIFAFVVFQIGTLLGFGI